MEKKLISIVVPVYNVEKHLDNCVISVLNQTYSQWELMLVDDGSSDNSGAICDKYSRSNPQIRVIHQQNAGVSAARNQGIEHANGQYIVFLDADDTLPEDSLEVLIHSIIDSNADIAMGTTCGEKWGLSSGHKIWKAEDGICNSLKDDPYTYSACGKIFSKEIIGETRFDTGIRINEDSFFIFRLMCKNPICICIDETVYQYTQVIGSASRSAFSKKYFDILIVSQKKYEIVQEQFPHLLDLAKNMIIKANLNLLVLLASRTNGEYLDVEQKLIKNICSYREYYVSVKKSDDKIFSIVVHGLYPLYKKGIKIKQFMRRMI